VSIFFRALSYMPPPRTVVVDALPAYRSLLRRHPPPRPPEAPRPLTVALTAPLVADLSSVKRYRELCSYEGGRYLYPTHVLPPAFLQAETYTLQEAALRESGVDSGRLHTTRIRLEQRRPIEANEPLTLECTVDSAEADPDAVTVRVAAEAAGTAVSTTTFELRPSYPDTVDLDPIRRIPWSTSGHVVETVSILTGGSRDYIRAGFGPLSWRTASTFGAVWSGFPHAQAHETWLLGRLLAGLAGRGWLTLADGGHLSLDLRFHKCVPCPSRLLVVLASSSPTEGAPPSNNGRRRPPKLDFAAGVHIGVCLAQQPDTPILSGTLIHPPLPSVPPPTTV